TSPRIVYCRKVCTAALRSLLQRWNLVEMRFSSSSAWSTTRPDSSKNGFSAQNHSASSSGWTWTHEVPSSLSSFPHSAPMLPPGLVSVWSPPPVHDVTFDSSSSTQARVRSLPQAAAAVAQRRNDEVVCCPSWLTVP